MKVSSRNAKKTAKLTPKEQQEKAMMKIRMAQAREKVVNYRFHLMTALIKLNVESKFISVWDRLAKSEDEDNMTPYKIDFFVALANAHPDWSTDKMMNEVDVLVKRIFEF